jgi:hypothetical protein
MVDELLALRSLAAETFDLELYIISWSGSGSVRTLAAERLLSRRVHFWFNNIQSPALSFGKTHEPGWYEEEKDEDEDRVFIHSMPRAELCGQ